MYAYIGDSVRQTMTKQGILVLASIISTITVALFNQGSVEEKDLTKSEKL